MQWPAQPTCHRIDPIFTVAGKIEWRGPIQRERSTLSHVSDHMRTCSYCGSVHPEDLYNALVNNPGALLNGADWKYGWPHKFYLEGIPNPAAGQEAYSGSSSYIDETGERVEKITTGPASAHLFGKFYNQHLADDGFDEEARSALFALIKERSGIEFVYDPEKGLGYRILGA